MYLLGLDIKTENVTNNATTILYRANGCASRMHFQTERKFRVWTSLGVRCGRGRKKGKENCLLLLISHIHCGQGWRGKTAWTKKYSRSSWQKKPPLVYLRKKRAARRTFPKLWKMNGEKSSFSFSLAPSSWKRRLERVTKAAWILSFPADTMPPQRPSSELHHSRRYLELNNRKGSRAGGGGCLQRRKEGGIM